MLQFVVDDHAGSLCTSSADEQHDACTGVWICTLQFTHIMSRTHNLHDHQTTHVHCGTHIVTYNLHHCQCDNSQLTCTPYLITTHHNVLYVQLISIFSSSHGFLLSLPRGRSATLHLKFGTTYPLTSDFPIPSPPLNAVSKLTYLISFLTSLTPSSPPQIQPRADVVAPWKCSYYYKATPTIVGEAFIFYL